MSFKGYSDILASSIMPLFSRLGPGHIHDITIINQYVNDNLSECSKLSINAGKFSYDSTKILYLPIKEPNNRTYRTTHGVNIHQHLAYMRWGDISCIEKTLREIEEIKISHDGEYSAYSNSQMTRKCIFLNFSTSKMAKIDKIT